MAKDFGKDDAIKTMNELLDKLGEAPIPQGDCAGLVKVVKKGDEIMARIKDSPEAQRGGNPAFFQKVAEAPDKDCREATKKVEDAIMFADAEKGARDGSMAKDFGKDDA